MQQPERNTTGLAEAAEQRSERAADRARSAIRRLERNGEPVSFDTHIKPLFRDQDRQSMSFAFDLSSADDVRTHAAGILQRLQDGTMPCDGAWAADQIAIFERWTETGMDP